MDTSKTYIKMCDCPEIQEGHEHGEPDYIAGKLDNESWYVVTYCDEHTPYEGIWRWLPRQDQLQEMVIESLTASLHDGFEHRRLIVLTGRFRDFVSHCFPEEPLYSERFDSMEQLWLAFVMKEKHGKVWNGSAWENSGERPQE